MIFLQRLRQVCSHFQCVITQGLTLPSGSAISWDGHFNAQTEDDAFASVIDYVLNCGCFIYIGAWLPFSDYNSLEYGITPWRLIVLMIAILVLRRIPPLLVLYKFIPEIASWREALFSGHFGKQLSVYTVTSG
jgi:NhaP-type Na+/H+ or K+/H+ antiporter